MPIICEVFSESDGPVKGMLVRLRCLDNETYIFEGLTDYEGKIAQWYRKGATSTWPSGSSGSVLTTNDSSWMLSFYAGPFLPDESPFPCIRAEFRAHQKAHHDIHLLLDTNSYSFWVLSSLLSPAAPPTPAALPAPAPPKRTLDEASLQALLAQATTIWPPALQQSEIEGNARDSAISEQQHSNNVVASSVTPAPKTTKKRRLDAPEVPRRSLRLMCRSGDYVEFDDDSE